MRVRVGHLHDLGDAATAARPAPGIFSELALPIFSFHSRADLVLRLPDPPLKPPPDSAEVVWSALQSSGSYR